MLQGWRTRNCNGLNLTASVVRLVIMVWVMGRTFSYRSTVVSTLRDDGGDMADSLYPVLSWLTWPMSVGKWTLEGIETRAQLLDSDGLLRQSSDPYIMVREAYFQRHDFIANGGELKPQENPNAQAIQDDLKDIDSE